ncbi:MAG: lantibiotic dehydratase [Pseudonocardiales bacterium]
MHHRLGETTSTTRPASIDLELDIDVQVPGPVLDVVADAGRLLTITASETPGRRSWRGWHARFVERFGVGAAVAVTTAVDPVDGAGWPEHLQRGYSPGPPRWQHRDHNTDRSRAPTCADRGCAASASAVRLSAQNRL